MTILQAIVLAVIEGVSEFLPISSTGHMILGSWAMGIEQQEFVKVFTVAIQFGAILSVVVLYWRRFLHSLDFYFKLFVGFLPAVVFGLLLHDAIDAMLGSVLVVAISLMVGGVILLFVDRYFAANESRATSTDGIGYLQALWIGFFQVLAMVPGTSRSAATIVGGLFQGLNRRTAAEFSFFLAVPTMFGATVKSLYDYIHDGGHFTRSEAQLLLLGNAIAFVVAWLAIKSFIGFLAQHGFRWFGYYRIAVGIAVLVLWALGHGQIID